MSEPEGKGGASGLVPAVCPYVRACGGRRSTHRSKQRVRLESARLVGHLIARVVPNLGTGAGGCG